VKAKIAATFADQAGNTTERATKVTLR